MSRRKTVRDEGKMQNNDAEKDDQKRNMARYDIRAGDIPRDVFPTGRVKFSLGVPYSTDKERELAKKDLPDVVRRKKMEELREHFAWDVLHAIQAGRFNVADVVRRMQENGKSAIRELQLELATPVATSESADEVGVSFAEKKTSYLEWYKEKSKPSSYNKRRSQLGKLGRQSGADGTCIDEIDFNKVTSMDIEAAISALGVKPRTQEGYRVSVSAVYTREIRVEQQNAEKEEREPRWFRNPAALVEIDLDDEDDCSRAVTPEEFAKLWSVAQPYQQAYLALCYGGGLRQGELQHLRLELDLNVSTWLVKIQKRGPDPRCTCEQCQGRGWKPKNKNAPRSVHLPKKPALIRSSIELLLEMYPAQEGDFVFRNPRTGRVWTQKALQEDFAALCELAGVLYGRDDPEAITFHSLRHSCATNLLRVDVPLDFVAKTLGDTPATVSKYYNDLTAHDLGEGISRTSDGGAWPAE